MTKSIAAVALVAGMLSLPGSVQAGGYDGYYYGGGYEGGGYEGGGYEGGGYEGGGYQGGGYGVPYPPRGPLPPVAISSANPPATSVCATGLWMGVYTPSGSPKLWPMGRRPVFRRALCNALRGSQVVSRV